MPFRNEILGSGGELVRTRIKSDNYVPGVSGWDIERNGNAEFNNLVARGNVTVVGPNGSIKITNVIPAELVAYYAPDTVQSALLFIHSSGAYEYIVTLNTNFSAYGSVSASLNVLGAYSLTNASSEVLMAFGLTSVQIPTNGVNGNLIVGSDQVYPSYANLNENPNATTTTSATFVDFPDNTLNFSKRYTNSAIHAEVSVSISGTVANNTQVEIGIQVNGTDYALASFSVNPQQTNFYVCGARRIAAGLAANSYTTKLRWRRKGGTGTLNTDANSITSLTLREVP